MNGRKDRSEVLHNTRIKSYPDGASQVLCCSDTIFHDEGWEPVREEKKNPPRAARKPRNAPEKQGDQSRSMRRARAQVRDIALCTPFRYFVTLTLDAAQVDRYDITAITRKLNRWLDNQVRRKGLAYVLVPERHKDGAIHFHGFFNDALETVDSGTITGPGFKKPRKPRSATQRAQWLQNGGQVVYNLPGWTLGFTTAIELYGPYTKAVSYVCKYIGKDGQKVGGRWFYSGGQLGRPTVEYTDASFRDLEKADNAYCFSVPWVARFVLINLPGTGLRPNNCTIKKERTDKNDKEGIGKVGGVPAKCPGGQAR